MQLRTIAMTYDQKINELSSIISKYEYDIQYNPSVNKYYEYERKIHELETLIGSFLTKEE